MFLGHFAVGFASKRIAPRASLGPLLAAPLFVDLLWPIFLLTGWERVRIVPGAMPFTPLAFDHYPITHSLVGTAVWSVVFAGAYWLFTRYGRGTIVVGLGVLSHWALDLLTHRPDLPLFPGGPVVGLGLWYSPAATIVVEAVLFVAGVWLYGRGTRARDRVGRWAWWGLVALVTGIFLAAAFGPPPPSVRAIAFAGLGTWIFPVWAWWLDRHRTMVAAA